jgi:hypothetical protein
MLLEQIIYDAPIPGIIRSTVRKDGLRTGAVFSLDELYRYVLWWVWDSRLPVWLYALLNSSTATQVKLDPTLTRQVERTRRGGGGGIVVVNSGAIRETDSKKAVKYSDPIGPHNRDWVKLVARQCDMCIAGYGPMASKFGGDKLFADIFKEMGVTLHRLELTNSGIPRHPLYTSYDVQPVPFELPI